MENHSIEKEVKFYLQNLPGLQNRLREMGATCVSAQTHEYNLRFDTPDRQLGAKGQVLRLRKDSNTHLTYKGPSDPNSSIAVRTEIEILVGDFDQTKALLEALGFKVFIVYEKYRTTFRIGVCEVMLDEMPFGNFAEIEGPGEESIQQTGLALGLNWDARSTMSYLVLFATLTKNRHLSSEHILFHDLSANDFNANDFGLVPADL